MIDFASLDIDASFKNSVSSDMYDKTSASDINLLFAFSIAIILIFKN